MKIKASTAAAGNAPTAGCARQDIAIGFSRSSFFFQAEDGIRDLTVTGVQTCALPISSRSGSTRPGPSPAAPSRSTAGSRSRPRSTSRASPRRPCRADSRRTDCQSDCKSWVAASPTRSCSAPPRPSSARGRGASSDRPSADVPSPNGGCWHSSQAESPSDLLDIDAGSVADDAARVTLAELLVALVTFGLVAAAVVTLLDEGQRAWAYGAARAETQQSARVVMARLTAEIRGAGRGGQGFDAVAVAAPEQIVLQQDLDGDGVIAARGERGTWRLAGAILRRGAGGGAQPVIKGARAGTLGDLGPRRPCHRPPHHESADVRAGAARARGPSRARAAGLLRAPALRGRAGRAAARRLRPPGRAAVVRAQPPRALPRDLARARRAHARDASGRDRRVRARRARAARLRLDRSVRARAACGRRRRGFGVALPVPLHGGPRAAPGRGARAAHADHPRGPRVARLEYGPCALLRGP